MNRKNDNPLIKIVELAEMEQKKGGVLTLDRIRPLLNEMLMLRLVPKGDYISTANSSISKVYYVLSGSFMISRSSAEGKSRIVVREKAPQFLYVDHAVLSDTTSDADILSLDTCIVLEINRTYFIQSIKEDGEFCYNILHKICKNFYDASRHSDQILFYDTPTKVMLYITNYWLTHHLQQHQDRCIIAVNNTLIADEIGISARTFYRTLDKLKKGSLLSIAAGNIAVTDEQITKMQNLCKDAINDYK